MEPKLDPTRVAREARVNPRRAIREVQWEGTNIRIEVEIAEPGTPLDEQLKAEQTRAFYSLLIAAARETPTVAGSKRPAM
jgi:hypothetical protein